MTNLLVKKLIVIASVIIVVVGGAIVLAFTTGNRSVPSLEDPKGIFYERLDSDGNVIYSITNGEIFEQIKSNNGIQQLLLMVDTELLAGYLANITETEIDDKLLILTYGTDDLSLINELTAEEKQELETDFARSMLLAGYEDNPEEYASLLIAREKYAYDMFLEALTDVEVATAFINSYFEDMQAINIRFNSEKEAESVLEHFHLASLTSEGVERFVEYLGYVFEDETMLDGDDLIAEAYEKELAYYFDVEGDIYNTEDEKIYTKGANDTYTDSEQNTYTLDSNDNLINTEETIVIPAERLLISKERAIAYEELNTIYYTMHKNDNFDEDETIILKDSSDNVVYKVDKDDNIFDASDNDITSTTEDKLFYNKIYTEQADVEKFTINNTESLTDQEILNYFIKIYNYVYGEFRDMLTEGSSVETLVGLNSEYLMYNFDETNEKSSGLATFLFDTISVNNEVPYNASPKSISTGGTSYYHLAYKLSEPDKTDLETTVLDLLESAIVLPEVVVTDFELPTSGEYGATITWVSADKEVISNTGQVTTPDEASIVDMQYTIKALGKTRTGTISVSVILTGENDTVTEPNITYPELSTLISEEIYDELLEKLANDKITGSNASQNINTKLAELRSDLEFEIFDYYLTLDYKEIDSNYDLTNKGSKTIIAKIKTSADSEFIEFTADDVFEYTMEKNPAVYVIYAGQFKEMLYSEYYEAVFGSEMNLKQNSTDEMENMYRQVTNAKSNYSYYQQLYAQYGLEYPYETFNDFSYVQYGTKTELELLEYFVSRRLQPYYIQMLIEEVKATELIYPTIEENFDNFFSLNVEQLLIYIDFDEDGRPDDFNEYLDGLTTTEKTDFNTLIASLEQNIEDYNEEASSTYTKLVTEFKNASFEDEDWGTYKKHGIYLKQESLNIADEEEEGVYHSLNYSGEYGVKDSYVKEFTDKLISMYQEYILPQNVTLKELDNSGDLLKTEFGLHLILATKGDDFTGISAKFTEADNNGVEYSNDSYNDEDLPSIEQLELYTSYKFYEMTYDLSDADIEEKEGIDVPDIPKSVIEAIDFYLAGSLDDFYVMGSVNIKIAEFLSLGRFLENDLVNLTNAELLAKLDEAKDVYYDAVVGKYTE